MVLRPACKCYSTEVGCSDGWRAWLLQTRNTSQRNRRGCYEMPPWVAGEMTMAVLFEARCSFSFGWWCLGMYVLISTLWLFHSVWPSCPTLCFCDPCGLVPHLCLPLGCVPNAEWRPEPSTWGSPSFPGLSSYRLSQEAALSKAFWIVSCISVNLLVCLHPLRLYQFVIRKVSFAWKWLLSYFAILLQSNSSHSSESANQQWHCLPLCAAWASAGTAPASSTDLAGAGQKGEALRYNKEGGLCPQVYQSVPYHKGDLVWGGGSSFRDSALQWRSLLCPAGCTDWWWKIQAVAPCSQVVLGPSGYHHHLQCMIISQEKLCWGKI